MNAHRIAGTSFYARRLEAERAQLREHIQRENSRTRTPDPDLAAHCAPALKPVKPRQDDEPT